MNPDTALIDTDRLESIDAVNDPAVAEIIRQFIQMLPEALDEIRAGFDRGDQANVKFLVHRLKGRCLTCCFRELAHHLADWEFHGLGEDNGRLDLFAQLARDSVMQMESVLSGHHDPA